MADTAINSEKTREPTSREMVFNGCKPKQGLGCDFDRVQELANQYTRHGLRRTRSTESNNPWSVVEWASEPGEPRTNAIPSVFVKDALPDRAKDMVERNAPRRLMHRSDCPPTPSQAFTRRSRDRISRDCV